MGGVVNQEAGNSCKGGCLQQEMRAQICATVCACVDTYEYTTYSPELLWSGRFRREQAQQADLIQGLLVGRRIATSCKGRRKVETIEHSGRQIFQTIAAVRRWPADCMHACAASFRRVTDSILTILRRCTHIQTTASRSSDAEGLCIYGGWIAGMLGWQN